jgi:hypothetical protein
MSSSAASNNVSMPSEASFIKQAELAREALKNFTTVSGLVNAPNIVRPALNDVVQATVCLSPFFFLLKFVSNPLSLGGL